MDQLKEFARRASLERDECLERERAAARDRGGGGNSNNHAIRSGRDQGDGVEVMVRRPTVALYRLTPYENMQKIINWETVGSLLQYSTTVTSGYYSAGLCTSCYIIVKYYTPKRASIFLNE